MNLPDSPVAEMPRPAATIKFTYPSGSRPLEGYTVKRGVGRGGFGEVYFATSDAGKEVALKLIRRNLDVELRGATQCLNLKHPNLIGLHDIRTDEMGDQWIIMEYVSGESLEDVIERHPNGMPIDLMHSWMRGICAGVAYLHDHGIVHRDLKPGNIFIDEGIVKIGDYGLAKFISCSRRSGQTESVGTVHYMAPEIANGRYGREIDTYALGIILFEMLTGTVPFEGESIGEVLMKHLTAEPDLTKLQEPYRDIVRRTLAKDPEVRLKSVGELVALMPGGAAMGQAAFGSVIQTPVMDEAIPLTPVTPNRPAADFSKARPGEAASPKARIDQQYAGPSTLDPKIEEPLWAAMRDGFDHLQFKAGITEPKRRVHVAAAICVVLFVIGLLSGTAEGVIGLGLTGLICYGAYYLMWSSLIRPSVLRQSYQVHEMTHGQPNGGRKASAVSTAQASATSSQSVQLNQVANRSAEPTGQPASSATAYAAQARRRRMRANWRERANRQLVERPLRERLSELFGAMLLSAIVVTVAALVAPVLGMGGLATYLWLAIVGTLGTWAVLIPAKFVEGRLEDQVPMRLAMLLLGGLIGLAAFGIDQSLLVSLPRVEEPFDAGQGLFSHNAFRWERPDRNGGEFHPTLSMYVTFFACLFVLPRWWRQAEFTRSVRLSVWWVLSSVFVAWFVHLFWWFPQPAGFLVAGMMAIAIQLASPWMPPSRRRALAEEIEQGV